MSWPTSKHEIVKGYYFKQFMLHSIVHHKNSCTNKNCKLNNYFCSFWRIPHSILLSLLLLEVIHHFIITKTILISEYTCQRALVQMEIPPSIKNGVESKVLASIPTGCMCYLTMNMQTRTHTQSSARLASRWIMTH